MKRRNFILGIGLTTVAGSLTTATSAFSSVKADRDIDVAVTDDSAAYLSVEPTDNVGTPRAQDEPYAEINDETGRFTLNFPALNPDAITTAREIFKVTNRGRQDVGVHFETTGGNGGKIRFFDQEGNRLDVTESDAVRVEPGNGITVDVKIDTTGLSSDQSVVDNLLVKADADAGGSS